MVLETYVRKLIILEQFKRASLARISREISPSPTKGTARSRQLYLCFNHPIALKMHSWHRVTSVPAGHRIGTLTVWRGRIWIRSFRVSRRISLIGWHLSQRLLRLWIGCSSCTGSPKCTTHLQLQLTTAKPE